MERVIFIFYGLINCKIIKFTLCKLPMSVFAKNQRIKRIYVCTRVSNNTSLQDLSVGQIFVSYKVLIWKPSYSQSKGDRTGSLGQLLNLPISEISRPSKILLSSRELLNYNSMKCHRKWNFSNSEPGNWLILLPLTSCNRYTLIFNSLIQAKTEKSSVQNMQ